VRERHGWRSFRGGERWFDFLLLLLLWLGDRVSIGVVVSAIIETARVAGGCDVRPA
jgi:hypothetical protein